MSKIIKAGFSTTTVTNNYLWRSGVDQRIFLCEQEDSQNLVQLENSCFDSNHYDSLLTTRSVHYLLTKGNGLLLLYKHEQQLAGYAQVVFKYNLFAGRFYSLAVHPAFQGKGIANLLFRGVEQTCLAVNAKTVLLEIREDNKILYYRYQKLGYQPYRYVADYYPDGCRAIKMKRDIFSD